MERLIGASWPCGEPEQCLMALVVLCLREGRCDGNWFEQNSALRVDQNLMEVEYGVNVWGAVVR